MPAAGTEGPRNDAATLLLAGTPGAPSSSSSTTRAVMTKTPVAVSRDISDASNGAREAAAQEAEQAPAHEEDEDEHAQLTTSLAFFHQLAAEVGLTTDDEQADASDGERALDLFACAPEDEDEDQGDDKDAESGGIDALGPLASLLDVLCGNAGPSPGPAADADSVEERATVELQLGFSPDVLPLGQEACLPKAQAQALGPAIVRSASRAGTESSIGTTTTLGTPAEASLSAFHTPASGLVDTPASTIASSSRHVDSGGRALAATPDLPATPDASTPGSTSALASTSTSAVAAGAAPAKRRRGGARRALPEGEPSPWVCEACGQGYSRAEYLRRHARTHEQEEIAKPWECNCGKRFGRSDVLLRHRRHCAMFLAISGCAGAGGGRGGRPRGDNPRGGGGSSSGGSSAAQSRSRSSSAKRKRADTLPLLAPPPEQHQQQQDSWKALETSIAAARAQTAGSAQPGGHGAGGAAAPFSGPAAADFSLDGGAAMPASEPPPPPPRALPGPKIELEEPQAHEQDATAALLAAVTSAMAARAGDAQPHR